MNIKPYSFGNNIKRIAKPITGKLRNNRATQIDEVTINFSMLKQNNVIGKINVIKADIRLSFKINEPT